MNSWQCLRETESQRALQARQRRESSPVQMSVPSTRRWLNLTSYSRIPTGSVVRSRSSVKCGSSRLSVGILLVRSGCSVPNLSSQAPEEYLAKETHRSLVLRGIEG